MTIAVLILGAIAVVLFFFNLAAVSRAEKARLLAEYERSERERSERMAREMLKEQSREEVARDLDSGSF